MSSSEAGSVKWEEEEEEERTTTSPDNTGLTSDNHKNGQRDILSTDLTPRFHGVSTQKSAFTSPRGTGVPEKGLRAELLEKDLIKSISQQVHAELKPQPAAPELSSVTKTDYKVKGFRGVRPSPSTDRDYRTDEAITFWKENFEKIQGVSAVRSKDAPFKKSSKFTTPIKQCLDANPENYPDTEEA